MHARVFAMLCSAGLTSAASAQFISPTWTVGDDHTAYYHWDVFTTPTGLNTPDVGQFPADAVATIQELNGFSLVTGSGNLYSFVGAQEIEMIFETNAPDAPRIVSEVLLQTMTLGSEWAYDDIVIDGVSAESITELARIDLGAGAFGGWIVTAAFEFTVLGNDSLTIYAPAVASSLSVDQVIVDVRSRPTCVADVNLDFKTDIDDLLMVLGSFGSVDRLSDFDADGSVDIDDLLQVLGDFGCQAG